jgi:MFS family permease
MVNNASAAPTVQPKRSGLRRHRDFRRLWFGDTVSQFGTQVTVLAVPLTAVLYLNASRAEVGVLTALEFVGFLVIGLPAGAWCDRWHRRPVMVTADLARFLLLLSIPVAAWAHALTIWQLFAVLLLVSVATVFFDVAYQSYLPALIDADDLTEGNAKLQGSAAVAMVAGPSIAGFLIQSLRAPIAIVVDAVSFAISALSVATIRKPEESPARPESRRLRTEIAEGLQVVRGQPVLRTLAAATATLNFFMAAFSAIVMIFLARTLELSAGMIGVLMTIGSVGGLAGAVLTSPMSRRFGQGRTAWVPLAIGCPVGLLIPLTHRGGQLALFIVGWFAFSFAITVYNIAGVTLRQTLCPTALLGRMNATMRFLSVGAMPVGALIGGALDAKFGPRTSLWITQIGQLAVPVILFASPLRGDGAPPGGADVPSQVDGVSDHNPVAEVGKA